jgi:hypothetical protein
MTTKKKDPTAAEKREAEAQEAEVPHVDPQDQADHDAGRTRLERTEDLPAEAQAAVGDAQERMDEDLERGYVGSVVDDVPNDAYTLTGQFRHEAEAPAMGDTPIPV